MDIHPALRLANDSTPISDSRWKWSVWVEGSDEDLDRIEAVRYRLHPTFQDPIRTVTDRPSKFKLETSGWGEFTIYAQVRLKNGDVVPLERWIRLEGRMEEPAGGVTRRPRVFLSAGAADRTFVQTLRRELDAQDVDVIVSDETTSGESVAESVRSALGDADLVALVVSGPLQSAAEQELEFARDRQKVVVPILLSHEGDPPVQIKGLQGVEVRSPTQTGSVADVLAARAKDVFYLE